MYEITCTLSREMLLALYLVKQTTPGSRIKEMKVHRAQMARHRVGSEAAVGALREGPLWISWNQASAAYVLSACAIAEMVRSDPTENCSQVEADALSCQAQSHDETPRRQEHTFTSPLQLSLTPSLPFLGSIEAQGYFSLYGEVPSHGFRRSCFLHRYLQAGHSARGSGGK